MLRTTPLTSKPILSIPDFIQTVTNLSQGAGPLWFRGAGKQSYFLLPTLYRHPTLKLPDQRLELERMVIESFLQRSFLYHPQGLKSEFETMFFMQHNEVPTRLLDWTESPLVALYFALTSASWNVTNKSYDEGVAVWVLRPVQWNDHALKRSDVNAVGKILAPSDEILALGYSRNTAVGLRPDPLAIFGIANSTRMVAQRGVFTIFGVDPRPMEDIYNQSSYANVYTPTKEEHYPDDCLMKFDIDANLIDPMKEEIYKLGFTESTIYPGLDGIAKEVKRGHGF